MTSTDWPKAFRAWLKQWRPHRVDPDWLRAYKLAFRAGWRAALRAQKAGLL